MHMGDGGVGYMTYSTPLAHQKTTLVGLKHKSARCVSIYRVRLASTTSSVRFIVLIASKPSNR